MFFILSKTISYLAMPMVMITLFLLLGMFLRSARWKKRCFRIGLFLTLFFSNEFIANEMMKLWEEPATAFRSINRTYAWGVVLTGVAKADIEPDDRIYFGQGADRVIHTVQLYKLGIIKKILVSGGSGRLINVNEQEAERLARVFRLLGIPDNDLLLESGSRNTHESAAAVVKMLDPITRPDECLLITSAFHIPRARACFKKEGWKLDTFSVDFYTHKRSFAFDVLFIPKLEAIGIWHHLIKETIGYASYKVMGYI